MTTITAETTFSRPTPKKLGPAPVRSANARDEYHRQLDDLVKEKKLGVRDRDFAEAALYAYSDATAKDFYPSQSTLADLRQCSTRTVQRRLAALKAAGVMAVAQLKGFDAKAKSWFCSSNTHRPLFLPEFVAKLEISRAAKRDARRAERVNAKAQPKKAYRDAGETRPAVKEFDELEIERRRAEALPPADQVAHARRARETLLRPQPPPVA
jgi:hypothetical protein